MSGVHPPPLGLLIHLDMPALDRECHALHLDHETLCCQQTETGIQRQPSEAG